ncbi:MAG: MATE family efflux transporter, partial [Muribaculaceae bacterium]
KILMDIVMDYGKASVSKLFKKLFFPTVLGMLFSALFIITDGIFVGQGLGSDALAAINIVAPIWLFSTGVGLMFGMGGAIVASIHLSRGQSKMARVNLTQAIVVSSVFLVVFSTVLCLFPTPVCRALGSSDLLLPYAIDYMLGFVPFIAINAILSSGGFFLRLGGAPKYSMFCVIVAAILNVILDYLFIFVFEFGIYGAAIASILGSVGGATMILIYLFNKKNTLHFLPFKINIKNIVFTFRECKYMCQLGMSSFLCEATIACMMLVGNFVFMQYLGENGVAAFSITCYFSPLIFMLFAAIAQSTQPIISYNYGINNKIRVAQALILALKAGVICGAIFSIVTFIFSPQIVLMFLAADSGAYQIAVNGLPIFALGFVFNAVNVIAIGYFQSVERIESATCTTVLRGFVFIVACFFILPTLFGITGIWLAIPVAEVLTLILIVILYLYQHRAVKRAVAHK